jgi:hypothetical protein
MYIEGNFVFLSFYPMTILYGFLLIKSLVMTHGYEEVIINVF